MAQNYNQHEKANGSKASVCLSLLSLVTFLKSVTAKSNAIISYVADSKWGSGQGWNATAWTGTNEPNSDSGHRMLDFDVSGDVLISESPNSCGNR